MKGIPQIGDCIHGGLSETINVQGPGSWQVHYTDEGRAYYHNSITGQTQWEVPQHGA